MTDEGYSHIGALLRQAREEKHLSLDQVAKQMHIRLRYLQALEEGRISELPGLAYAKGYLQAYAQYLGLDPNEIMRRFEQIEGVFARKGFFLPQVFSKEKKPSRGLMLWGVLLALLAYTAWAAWFSPPSAEDELVENPQKQESVVHITPQLVLKTPCLQPPEALYPPCYVQPVESQIFPLRRRYDNVMQWAASQL